MQQYRSLVALTVNGKDMPDFKSVTEKSTKVRKMVETISGQGFREVPQRPSLEIEYLKPKGAAFDWTKIVNGTLGLVYDDGTTESFKNVTHLETGDLKYDVDGDPTQSITLICDPPMAAGAPQ